MVNKRRGPCLYKVYCNIDALTKWPHKCKMCYLCYEGDEESVIKTHDCLSLVNFNSPLGFSLLYANTQLKKLRQEDFVSLEVREVFPKM